MSTLDAVAAHNAQTEDPDDHLIRRGDAHVAPSEIRALMRERDEARAEANSMIHALWPYWTQQKSMPAAEAITRLVGENERLRDAIEEFLLWEPDKAGHAAATARLRSALGEKP
jgi:hypothetical protein